MLEYSREFLVLAANLNYKKAATLLNVSQPALSRHILQLEKEVGAQLIERTPLSLTSAGKYYLEHISPIIAEVDDICKQCRNIRKAPLIQVRLYPSPLNGMANMFFISAINATNKTFPDAEFKLKQMKTASPTAAVLDDEVDAAPIYYYPNDIPEGFICELLYEEPINIWVHQDNPLSQRKRLELSDFSDMFLVNSVDSSFEGWNRGVRDACKNHGFFPKVRLKDLEDVTDFILGIRPDEYLITSSFMGERIPRGSQVVARTLDKPNSCLYSTYLFYRDPKDNPVLESFISNLRMAVDRQFTRRAP